MKIAQTALLLTLTLLVVPLMAWFSGTALGPRELHALQVLLWILLAAWLCCFALGEFSGNVSQVDRVWSILPIFYAWTVAWHGEMSERLLLMAALVTLWGLRLTWNFSRHGAYKLRFWEAHEDYRWQVLRDKPEFQSRWRWSLFNFGFISGYQNMLILSMTLPAIVALQFDSIPLGWLDGLATALMLGLILLETLADNQQWRYQSAKRTLLEEGKEPTGAYAKGFLDTGLWAWSRHPNYFAEQGIWISFYLFSVAASGQWLNWSISGSLLLILLFQGSSTFSEEISSSKYPAYRNYQETVPRFIPRRPRNDPGD